MRRVPMCESASVVIIALTRMFCLAKTCLFPRKPLKKRFVGGPPGPVHGHCSCHGSGITSILTTSLPCPSTTTFDSTSYVDVVTATGSCWSTSSVILSPPRPQSLDSKLMKRFRANSSYCSCTASTSTVNFTTTTPECNPGPYTAVIIQA